MTLQLMLVTILIHTSATTEVCQLKLAWFVIFTASVAIDRIRAVCFIVALLTSVNNPLVRCIQLTIPALVRFVAS